CCVNIQHHVVHLDSTGQKLLADVPMDIGDLAVDKEGNLIATVGSPIKATPGAFLANACPSWFIAYAKFNAAGQPLFVTYLPQGADYDFHGADTQGVPLLRVRGDLAQVSEEQSAGVFLGCTLDAGSFLVGDVISPGEIVT